MNWIKSTDKLPPNFNDVLITDGKEIKIADYSIKRKSGCEWAVRGTVFIEPVFWMPLPALP